MVWPLLCPMAPKGKGKTMEFNGFSTIDTDPDLFSAGWDRLEDQLSTDEEWAQEVYRRQYPNE